MTDPIRYERDDDGVVTLTMDMPGQSANTMNSAYSAAMEAAVARLESEADDVRGVVVTSAKDTFFAGGDLRMLIQVTPDNVADFAAGVAEIRNQLRRLEQLGKPVVAAINGSALGGGWEIALACHRRICLDDPRIQLGLPEVTLGLMPGSGGVVRTVRMLGLVEAMPLLTEGKQQRPDAAHKAGLVDELAGDVADLAARAKQWILSDPDPTQPWDRKGYEIPGGSPNDPGMAPLLAAAPAMLTAKTHGAYPAPEKILSSAVEGAQVDVDTALQIETRHFAELASGQIAKNMINTFWFQLNEVNAGRSRPDAPPRRRVSKVGVLGAGMMGAGIAYVCARAGIDVVLKDVTAQAAERGRQHCADLLDKRVSRGRMSASDRDAVLAHLMPTAEDSDLAGCDLVVEAVFEKRALKEQVLASAAAYALPEAVIASNTSTLPITGLAEAVPQPQRFVGLHFFSPVDKMKLVEIIRGQDTDDETLARAFDFVRQISKTPIVVNDSRGFYTSRVFAAYALEGMAMVAEGVPPAMVENVARSAGMAAGPLTVTDEVSLSLMWQIHQQTVADLGADAAVHPAMKVVDAFVNKFDRPGKAAGGGFYEYPAEGKKHLWPQLSDHYPPNGTVPESDVRDRLLFAQALETVRCLDEGVVTSTPDANVGAVFGWGFAPWSGGTLQFVNAYGLREFVDRSGYLAQRYGERFAPPESLEDLIARGERFPDAQS